MTNRSTEDGGLGRSARTEGAERERGREREREGERGVAYQDEDVTALLPLWLIWSCEC
jgi:hypothetical protein